MVFIKRFGGKNVNEFYWTVLLYVIAKVSLVILQHPISILPSVSEG